MTTEAKKYEGFSDAERAAMKERAEELKTSGKGGKKKAEELEALIAKVAELPDHDRLMAERIHAIVTSVAPQLDPKTWYGMPAYAKDGKIVVFFKPASKFESRYATLGFEEAAQLDDGDMWVTSYALVELGDAEAEKITALVKKAAG